LFEERMKSVLPNNLIKTIEFNADDYAGLTKEQAIKKLSKFSKKYLLTLLPRKKISKADLVNQICEFYLKI
jgi:hypothetical protein